MGQGQNASERKSEVAKFGMLVDKKMKSQISRQSSPLTCTTYIAGKSVLFSVQLGTHISGAMKQSKFSGG